MAVLMLSDLICSVGFLIFYFPRYKSLVYFMFAAEVGMEVPLYNAAMLCEENQVRFY